MMNDTIFFFHLYSFQPFGKSFGNIFLDEPRFCDSVGKTLHRDRSSANVRQHDRSDPFIVSRELALGNSIIRKEDLLGVCDHVVSLVISQATLSVRTPNNRGCRNLPCVVHSIKATCTTISGRTQCARLRCRPTALVNGVDGSSS